MPDPALLAIGVGLTGDDDLRQARQVPEAAGVCVDPAICRSEAELIARGADADGVLVLGVGVARKVLAALVRSHTPSTLRLPALQ